MNKPTTTSNVAHPASHTTTATSANAVTQKPLGTQSEGGFPLPNPFNPDLRQDLKELGEAEGDLAADKKLGDKDDIKRDRRNIREIKQEIANDISGRG
jgi:hypothetical protein